ncbi:MAG: gliding motility-associated C-terminal domain-containing protein, partial [Chitinophagaceae bacterium]
DVSIGLSSRNINLNNLFTEQNFFNYTSLNLCEGLNNSSVDFTSVPNFLHVANQSNYQSLGVINSDGDSLVFSLKPALRSRTVSVSYALGYDYDYPFNFYCTGAFPCSPNITGPIVEGFYISKTTGDIAFTPNTVNQGGVIVVECEEYKKKTDGSYYLAGVTRRDIYSDVVSQNNNLPRFKNRILEYKVCEGEDLKIDLDIDDLPVLGSPADTVFTDVISTLPGTVINKIAKNGAPFYSYSVQLGNTNGRVGKHYITVTARDNSCPLRGTSSKTFVINVLKNRKHKIQTQVKNCGVLDFMSSNMPSTAFYWTLTDQTNTIIRQQQSRKVSVQLPSGGTYYITSFLPADGVYCELKQIDTVVVKPFTRPEIHMGADINVCKNGELSLQPRLLNTYDKYQILVNGLPNAMPYKQIIKSAGLFNFKVLQDEGCWAEDNINVNLFPQLNYKVYNDTFCLTNVFPAAIKNIVVDRNKIFAIDLQATEASSSIHHLNAFDWEIDVINPVSHNQKIYSLIVDKNHCSYFDTFNILIEEPDPINVKIPQSICINSEPLSLPLGKNGNWQCVSRPDLVKNNVLSTDPADRRDIELLYTENIQCRNTKSFTVQLKDTSAITFGHDDHLKICQNAVPFDLKGFPSGGTWKGNYLNGDKFLSDKAAGKTVKLVYTYSNLSDCISEAPVEIQVEKLPELSIKSSGTKVCVGGVLDLTAISNVNSPGYWYTDGEGTFDRAGSRSTHYTPKQSDVSKPFLNFVYTLQTNNICGNVSAEVMVIVRDGQVGEIVKNYPTTICEPAKLTFKSTFTRLEKQYWLVNDSIAEEFDYNFDFNTTLKAGEYVIKTRVNDSTCEAMAISEIITVLPKPEVKIHSNPGYKLSREYPRLYLKDLSYCKYGHSTNWYINNDYIGDSRELNYKVEEKEDTFWIKLVATSGKGDCKDSLSQMFVFIPINQLYIPNAFSPDAKGPNENNVFKVIGPPMRSFSIEIFNRYGEKVYISNDMNAAWDGYYKNKICIQGDYFYKIETTDLEGVSRDYSGTVTVIR